MVSRGKRVGNEEMPVQVQTSSNKRNKFRGSNVQFGDRRQPYHIVCLKVVMRVDLKCSHHRNNMVITVHKVINMLSNRIVVIISKYVCVSNLHIVYLKRAEC